MSDSLEPRSSPVYEGVWGLLTNVMCVPRHAPMLPSFDSESIVSRKPSPGFLRYLKFQFWIGLALGLIGLTIASFVIVLSTDNAWYLLGTAAIGLLVGAIVVISYIAIYLRFDTTWYVFSDRSMRLRRGIWLIRESTITFENIQNVKVTQGPVQRLFGIANVVVETAGGGSAPTEPGSGFGMHAGLIEGVAEAAEIRDSIMSRVRAANTTGLGDEISDASGPTSHWTSRQLEVLKEIRDLARQATA